MLIKRIFYRELVSNAVKIFVVLVLILPVTELFKLLDQAQAGSIPVVAIVTVMLCGTIASFPMILTIASFLTIVITINRFCRDNEFAVWLSCGVGPFYWLKQIIYFALPLSIICAACSMYVTPWATRKATNYQEYVAKQQVSLLLSPGVFRETPDKKQIFYVQNYSLAPSVAHNIFVKYIDHDKMYNITAVSGALKENHGNFAIVLKDGHRYELENSTSQNLELNFKEFSASIHQNNEELLTNKTGIPTSNINQLILQKSTGAKAELSWRISIALMLFVMCCIALPISIQLGRIQNSLIFILPPTIYALYQNLILTINGYIGGGQVNSLWYMFLIHIAIFIIAIGLTYIKSLPRGYLWSRNK